MPNKVLAWVEDHPTESIVIGVGGAVVLMWLLGFFSSSSTSSSNSSGAGNMAAAYYAAEAQQAVVGGQIQVANINATAQTAQTKLATDAATAIASTNAAAATTINGQNSTTALATTVSNNTTQAQIDQSNNTAGLLQTYLSSVIPAEFATYGTNPFQLDIPGIGTLQGNAIGSPNDLIAQGFTPQQAAKAFGF